MSVDYFVCQNCGDTFPDCYDYFTCSSCESIFCSDKCGGRKIVEDDGISDQDLTDCVLCRMEVISDHDLIKYLLLKYNITYDEACEGYKNLVEQETNCSEHRDETKLT